MPWARWLQPDKTPRQQDTRRPQGGCPERGETNLVSRASGSIRDDDHIHTLVKEAVDEITRLRLLLSSQVSAKVSR